MSTTTSSAEGAVQLTEARRSRLERLLQCTTRDYDLRFTFGDRDRTGRQRIQAKAEAPSVGPLLPLKADALHLLGHYLAESAGWLRAALEEEAQEQPHFAALWHALENARVENRLVARWPGMRTTLESRLLPNLGGSLVRVMGWNDQLKLGLYLEGRGYHGAQYAPQIQQVLENVQGEIARGAGGATPEASLNAMRAIYPQVSPLLRLGASRTGGDLGAQVDESGLPEEPGSDKAVPEIELGDERVEVGVMGLGREIPEWYRPGSVPWFERGLGDKRVHPTAMRSDRQTIVPPPAGDYLAYRALWAEVQREVGFLVTRMTNLLREESYLRFGGQYRSGNLRTAKLYKQRLGNYRLFERPVDGERSVAFQLLVDESASMKGQDKYRLATKTALLLGETLTQMGLPLEILGFTTAEFEARAAMLLGLRPAHEYRTMRCSALEHRLYKRFEDPNLLVRRRLTGIEPRHNNWDEEHLLFAFRRLQGRPERTKVMIVISDGQPNGDANHLIATVAGLEAIGCRIIGVGIGAEFVRQVYRNAIVVTGFRKLAEELLTVLARELGQSAWAGERERSAAGRLGISA